MLTENKPVVIVGFPILSKLVRGLTVVLSDVCLIPDDQLHNESVNMSFTATFNEPQNEGNLEAVEQPLTPVKSSADATAEHIADCVCAELLISKHETGYNRVLSAVTCGLQRHLT